MEDHPIGQWKCLHLSSVDSELSHSPRRQGRCWGRKVGMAHPRLRPKEERWLRINLLSDRGR